MISAIAGSLRGGGETPGKAIKAQHAVQIQVSLDLLDSEAPSTRIQTVAWDPTQKMDELVKELVTAVFELEDTDPGQYCLQQVETGEWIYPNLKRRVIVAPNDHLRLSLSPNTIARRLSAMLSEDVVSEHDRKKALFRLQTHLKEERFLKSFVEEDGVQVLLEVLDSVTGNSLAYALSCFQAILESREPLPTSISIDAILKQMTLIMNESHLANVLRPATRISQLLALQLPAVERETFCLTLIKQFPSLLSRFMERMNNQDYFLQVYSLSFINMFLASIRNIQKRSKYTYDLDDLGIRRTLMQMVQRRPDPTLQKELVSFEGLLAKEYGRRQRMAIDPSNTVHQSALEEILNALRAERGLTKGTWEDFGMADPFEGLQPIGVLGLECLYTMFKKDRKELSRLLKRQRFQKKDQQCPILPVAVQVCLVLIKYWGISDVADYESDTQQTLILAIERVFVMCVRSFFYIWECMEASISDQDLPSVSNAFALHFASSMKRVESSDPKAFQDLESALLETPYAVLKERLMQASDLERQLNSVPHASAILEGLSDRSRSIVKNQRLECLKKGAWMTVTKDRKSIFYRFYRLSKDKQFLYFAEFNEKSSLEPSFDALTEHINVSDILEIKTISNPSENKKRTSSEYPASLSLMLTVIDTENDRKEKKIPLGCSSVSQASEWLDGLRCLKDSEFTLTEESEAIVQSLTRMETRLLALGIFTSPATITSSIQSPLATPALPPSFDFFYTD